MSYIICLWTTSACFQSVILNFSLDASKEKIIHTVRRFAEIFKKISVAVKCFTELCLNHMSGNTFNLNPKGHETASGVR